MNTEVGGESQEVGASPEHLYVSLAVPERGRPGTAAPWLDRWVGALRREVELRRTGGSWAFNRARTIHVGGGSGNRPGETFATRLRREVLGKPKGLEEFAIESEPADLDPRTLEAWLEAGVTRIALAPASREVLASAASAFSTVGLSNWGVDVEFGGACNPEVETQRHVCTKDHIASILDLAPSSISLVECDAGGESDAAADEFLEIAELLREAGYEQWELTSFARGGGRSRHFEAVWKGERYLGIGPGAHSFDGTRRFWNLDDPEAYFSTVEAGRDPVQGEERLTRGQRVLERLWSGLRLAEGLPLTDLPSGSWNVRARWVDAGLAHPDAERLRLTRKGWLLLDGLAVELAAISPADHPFPAVRSSDTT